MTTTVWITGARGFLGSHLSVELSRQKWLVIGIGHGQLSEREAQNRGLGGWLNSSVSISSLRTLKAQFGPPDVVCHLAGGSAVAPSLLAPLEDFERTVQSTISLLEWLRIESPATRLVYVSSAAVYGASHRGPIDEDCVATPYSPYGFHKYCAELVVREYAVNFRIAAVILRLFSVYGPGLRKQLLWDVAHRILGSKGNQLELFGTGNELRDWFYIDDAVALVRRAASWASCDVPTVNGGTGVATSVSEAVASLAIALGYSIKPRFNGKVRLGDPESLVASTRRAIEMGFHPKTTFTDGVGRTAAWLRQSITT